MNVSSHIVMVDVAALEPYAKNARTHSPKQIAQIAASIQEFGFTNPVLTYRKTGITAGHARVLAAKQLGMPQVPTIPLDYLTPAQRRAYVIADNQHALNAGWDFDILGEELLGLKEDDFDLSLLGFDDVDLDRLLGPVAGLTDPDDVPEVPEEPVSQTSDLWLLGRHRLLCGDSTIAADVERVLGGVQPHLMVTDPPYVVHLDHTWRDRSGANTKGRAGDAGKHYLDGGAQDNIARWDAAWLLAPVDVFYVFCAAGPSLIEAAAGLADTGFELRQILVWDKGVLTLTRTHYWYNHEHILYGVRKGKSAHWVGANAQPSVWSIPSPKHIMSGSKEKKEPHPTQRPVECMKRPIENNSSPGQAVYEPFSGSGTTIIAAEITGRAAHAIEIAPAYVDVAVTRWQDFTGKEASLDGDGRSFADIAAERKLRDKARAA